MRGSYAPSQDGTFLRAEPRWDLLTRRAEIGRSYAPSGDRTFLLPPDEVSLSFNFVIPSKYLHRTLSVGLNVTFAM